MTLRPGGSSYAALNLTNNSVLSKHIKNRQVKARDLGANSVSSAKVRDRSLRATDFAAGELPAGPKGDTGASGPSGPKGDRGPSFGDGRRAAVVTVPQCGSALLTSYTLTITEPSRISVTGQAYYQKIATDRPESPSIEVVLRDAGDTSTLARSAQMVAGSLSTSVNTSDPMTTAGILMEPDPSGVDSTPFVAQPGTYLLELVGAASSNCNAGATEQMDGISLNHIVLGTTP